MALRICVSMAIAPRSNVQKCIRSERMFGNTIIDAFKSKRLKVIFDSRPCLVLAFSYIVAVSAAFSWC